MKLQVPEKELCNVCAIRLGIEGLLIRAAPLAEFLSSVIEQDTSAG